MKLAIDPGHGFGNTSATRYDSGATGGGLTEADIVLQFGLTLKWVFSSAGIPVFMTRDDDRDIVPVSRRDDMAKAAGCTHMLCLHCNAGNVLATGTETYYRDDLRWAQRIQRVAVDALKLKDRGVKSEGASQHNRLAVMNFPGQVCLCELGFISSPKDRKVLISRDVRLNFATGVLKLWKSLR